MKFHLGAEANLSIAAALKTKKAKREELNVL